MADGHVNKCKDCNKKDVTSNRNTKVEYYREYDRHRGGRHTPEDRARYIAENPLKRAAHHAVNNAVRDGRLEKKWTCEECGRAPVNGHHDDYSKPLSVRWLCVPCHILWHKLNGPGLNG